MNGADPVARIAGALERIASLLEVFYEREYPPPRQVREALVTHRPSEEEALRQSQGESEESDREWVGERERRTAEAEAQSQRSGKKTGD